MERRLDPLYSESAVRALKQDPSAADYEARAVRRDVSYYDPFLQALPSPNAKVLDVGCGSGRSTLLVAERAKFTVGLDLSPTLLLLAHERQCAQAQTNVAWILGDIHSLPFADSSFDYIVSCNALRLTNLHLTLNRLKALLVPGGRLVIRDVVKPPPHPAVILLSHTRETARDLTSIRKLYGGSTARRYVLFRFSPSSLQSMLRERQWTPANLPTLYAQTFPNCQITIAKRKLIVSWDKPGSI
jgi:ubiquinone/menaquinone biosynthesis C-methylase UbiE